MNEQYIQTGSGQLHYLAWGTGKRIVLAFHGYGTDAGIFSLLEPHLGDDLTLLSIDLPHHGGSKWDAEKLTKNDLLQLVALVKKEYNVAKVSLLGYSLGGRVCLTIVELIPESIDHVTLLATDGLTENFYYSFFTRNSFGKRLFRKMLEKPAPYFKLLNWLRKKNLVDASRHKFVMHSIGTDESRRFLLRVWPSLSDLVPVPEKLKAAIKQYHIPVAIFMGVHDHIMPPALAEQFKAGLETVQLYVPAKGHRILDIENAEQIAHTLL